MAINPSLDEVETWIIEVINHVYTVEYYITNFAKIKGFSFLSTTHDKERPHDMYGEGNKLELEIILKFALQYRLDIKTPDEKILEIVLQARDYHTAYQMHHKIWNRPGGERNEATDYDMTVSAIDTIVSLTEDRNYRNEGKGRSLDEIRTMFKETKTYLESGQTLPKPRDYDWYKLSLKQVDTVLSLIDNWRNIPIRPVRFNNLSEFLNLENASIEDTLGISNQTYELMKKRVNEAIKQLNPKGYKIRTN